MHLATEEGFDIRKLIPAPMNTPEDAGPYITLGMCYATSPETGTSDVTIHRMCLQSKDEISIFLQPGAGHIGHFRELAEKQGKALPISISIGVDPAIEIASCFEPPTTPLGYDELQAAGAYLSLMTALSPEVAELNGDVTDNLDCASNENALVDFYGPVEFYTMKDEYEAMGDDKDGAGEFESAFVGVPNIYDDKEACDKTYWKTYKGQIHLRNMYELSKSRPYDGCWNRRCGNL